MQAGESLQFQPKPGNPTNQGYAASESLSRRQDKIPKIKITGRKSLMATTPIPADTGHLTTVIGCSPLIASMLENKAKALGFNAKCIRSSSWGISRANDNNLYAGIDFQFGDCDFLILADNFFPGCMAHNVHFNAGTKVAEGTRSQTPDKFVRIAFPEGKFSDTDAHAIASALTF